MKKKKFKISLVFVYTILIVWALTGLWHGASWNFVLWGLYYGLLLMLEKLFLLKGLNKCPALIRHIYTMFIVVIGWTIFAQTDFGQLATYLKRMFGIGTALIDTDFLYYFSCNAVLLAVLAFCSIDHRKWLKKFELLRIPAMIILLLVSFAFLVGGSYNPFLYFRF